MPKKPLTLKEKLMIINVRKYFDEEKNHGGLTNDVKKSVQRTADALGVSVRTVKRISHECNSKGTVEMPTAKSGRKRIECDEELQGVIRRLIFDYYLAKRFPTGREMYIDIRKEVPNLPPFSLATLYRWFKKLNFTYKKLNTKPILMEHPDIAAHRADFLNSLQTYRNRGWKIFYTDETWCGANHARNFGWVERVTPENAQSFEQYRGGIQEINGYRGGIKRPAGAGQRVIIVHIGSEDGFLPGATKCFIGEKKKAKADYHHEMNRQHYEEWFRLVLSTIPAKSVIMIDQAPYHTMLDPNFRNPTVAWKKADIITWLQERNVPVPEGYSSFSSMTRPQLLQLSRPHHHQRRYLLNSLVREMWGDEVKLLWLTVAHCEFNAIELIWAYIKNRVARNNNTFKIKDVHVLCQEAIDAVTPQIWQNCVRHAQTIENKYREKQNLIDNALDEPLNNMRRDEI